MKFYYTYDQRGFEVAKQETEQGDELYESDMPFILEFCFHDFNKGFCDSFQIYREDGVLIKDQQRKEAA